MDPEFKPELFWNESHLFPICLITLSISLKRLYSEGYGNHHSHRSYTCQVYTKLHLFIFITLIPIWEQTRFKHIYICTYVPG